MTSNFSLEDVLSVPSCPSGGLILVQLIYGELLD